MSQLTCDRCGAPISLGDLFCLNCGAVLDSKLGGSTWSTEPTKVSSPATPVQPKSESVKKPVAPAGLNTSAQAVITCSTCGTENDAQSRFCIICGKPLEKQVAPKPQAPVATITTKAARSFSDIGPSAEMSSGGPAPQVVQSEPIDDSATVVIDDEDDPDAPTFVFVEEPVLTLVRLLNGEVIALELPAVVGKGSKATSRISGNRGISRQHALITQEGDDYVLEDNESTNGTFIGEVRLAPHESTVLEDGMVFRLADEEFEFHID